MLSFDLGFYLAAQKTYQSSLEAELYIIWGSDL